MTAPPIRLADIIHRYRRQYRQTYRPGYDQIRAMNAILACRTPHYGQIQLACSDCQWQTHLPHSCGHRSCPQCQHHDTASWLDRQAKKLLPTDYFMVTFTLPVELRGVVKIYPDKVYQLLFQVAHQTLRAFGYNDRKLGHELGMTAVLHTHSRRLDYHPHIHVVLPGGCLDRGRRQWRKMPGKYLFNAFALARVFRGKWLQALSDDGIPVPGNLPKQWVADCRHVGKGLPALQYLSRYLYKGVIAEHRIISDDGTHVTFRYQESRTGKMVSRRVPGETFLYLVFQHVLPKGFRRIRDYGFLHGNASKTLRVIQWVMRVVVPQREPRQRPAFLCKQCQQPMRIIRFIPPSWRAG